MLTFNGLGGDEPFVVNIQDLGPGLNPSETILGGGGGYVGATDLEAGTGYGTVSSVVGKVSTFDQVNNWIKKNPIMATIGGIGLLLLLKGGRR